MIESINTEIVASPIIIIEMQKSCDKFYFPSLLRLFCSFYF